MTTIEFLFDFGSPNAYLCHRVLPALQARTGVPVRYAPVLLGGLFKLANNRSPIEAYATIPNKLRYEQLEMQRFVTRHGLAAYRANPHFPVNTLKIMRGAVAAQQLGCFEPYVEAVFVAMWEQQQNMADDDTIITALAGAGLPAAELLAATQRAEVKAQLMAHTQAAHDRGAFGIPTFFVGQDMFFGKDRLGQVEEAAQAARALP
jgi:2-hydroxychromene-2-carboxylate isomerase